MGAPDAYYIALRADVQVEAQLQNPHAAAYWSYSALVLQRGLGGRLPLWLTNGLAAVLSNTIVRNNEVDAFGGELADLCRATGVQLQRRESDAQGPLPATLVGKQAGRGSSVWFCGPSAWGESLRLWLSGAGLPGGAFHREYFEFR